MLERKKLKSWSPRVTESRSFLVRNRRTYVLKKEKKQYLIWCNMRKIYNLIAPKLFLKLGAPIIFSPIIKRTYFSR